MGFQITPEIREAIMAHGTAEYPKEACGIITPSGYEPQENLAENPSQDFRIDPKVFLEQEVLAVVHSHPDGPSGPTAADMTSQLATAVPWGICVVHPDRAETPFFWGDGIEIPPLLEREFRHGPSGTDGRGDCYALIRDWYRLERKIILPEFPRDSDWWKNGGDLYEEGFGPAGFVQIQDSPRTGDVFAMKLNASVINHAGVYIGGGLILHHLAGRLSRREPLGRWGKFIVKWMRHKEE